MRVAAVLIASAVLGACTRPSPARIEVQDARAGVSAPGQSQAAAYLTIRNDGGRAERLRSIRVEGVGSATVHESDMSDGVMRMRPMPELDLPSGETVTMAPGGLHIMLMDLKQPLRAGDKLRATLLFRQSPPLRLTIPVVSRKVLEAAHGQH